MGQSQAEESCDLVIVGAGLAALHLASRLPESLAQNAVVIDPSGAWMTKWAARAARLAAPHMRTPATQHPHASPGALQAWAERQGRQQELVPVVKGFAPVPTTALFADFCRAKVAGKLPAALRTPRADRVARLEPLGGPGGADGCRVHLASGTVLTARAVAWTPANRHPVLPAWARQLATPAGERAAEGPQPQLPPGILTSDSVDLSSPSAAGLEGQRVAVVGGGMSAGLLAAGAAERGAHVTLVCRRPLKPQPFETEVGWWGAKQLNGYRHTEGAAARLAACRRARKQGSVHLPVWRRLAAQAAAGRLTVLEGWEVAAAEPQPAEGPAAGATPGWQLSLKQWQPGEGCEPLPPGPTLFQQAVAATVAQAAQAASDGQQAPPAERPLPAAEQQQAGAPLAAGLVWLACGAAYDAGTDAVLARLAAEAPTPLTGGYPGLDAEHLCWPGAAVYVLGRGALLGVGPCAGDLPGMRLAADRVVASLRRLDYAADPVWVTARDQLLARLLPASGGDAINSGGASEASTAGGGDDSVARLAAAVAAAQAGEAGVPLEDAGLPWEEKRPKPRVARPEHLIDVSDLDPALPRKELARYTFTDDGFDLCVILQLEEAVPLEQVRTLFGEQRLEMWAVGGAAAYRLHVPRLYGRLIPAKCSVKVNQRARKVYLLLKKEADAEWRFLKG